MVALGHIIFGVFQNEKVVSMTDLEKTSVHFEK